MLASMGGAILLIVYIAFLKESHWIALVVAAGLGICMLLFGSLTVRGDDRSLEVRFGPGLIRKRFLLEEMRSCREVTNHWYYGWGIRLTPHGWLFNVSGLGAVEIEMRNGSRVRIGTDDVRGLVAFLSQQPSIKRILRDGECS